MNPWLCLLNPEMYFPFTSYAQNIEPRTNWFFNSILTTAGDGQIEQKAVEIASYGRQLGLITEVLLGIAEKTVPNSEYKDDFFKSLGRLKEIKKDIDEIKKKNAKTLVREIENQISSLKQKHENEYNLLISNIKRTAQE